MIKNFIVFEASKFWFGVPWNITILVNIQLSTQSVYVGRVWEVSSWYFPFSTGTLSVHIYSFIYKRNLSHIGSRCIWKRGHFIVNRSFLLSPLLSNKVVWKFCSSQFDLKRIHERKKLTKKQKKLAGNAVHEKKC